MQKSEFRLEVVVENYVLQCELTPGLKSSDRQAQALFVIVVDAGCCLCGLNAEAFWKPEEKL